MPRGLTTHGQLVSWISSPSTGPATASTVEARPHGRRVDDRQAGSHRRWWRSRRCARLGNSIGGEDASSEDGEARIGAADVADQDRKLQRRVVGHACHDCRFRPRMAAVKRRSLSSAKRSRPWRGSAPSECHRRWRAASEPSHQRHAAWASKDQRRKSAHRSLLRQSARRSAGRRRAGRFSGAGSASPGQASATRWPVVPVATISQLARNAACRRAKATMSAFFSSCAIRARRKGCGIGLLGNGKPGLAQSCAARNTGPRVFRRLLSVVVRGTRLGHRSRAAWRRGEGVDRQRRGGRVRRLAGRRRRRGDAIAADRHGCLRYRRRRLEHGAALFRQARHGHDVARLRRIRVLVGPPWLLGEPPGERLAAAVVVGRCVLRLAAIRAGLAADADMEMIVMAPERPDLPQPAAIAGDRVAELLLDARVDKDALDLGIARRALQQPFMRRRPQRGR